MNFSGPNSCGFIATVFVRTRSSGESTTAELKDFPGSPYQVDIDTNPIEVTCPAPVTITPCTPYDDIQTAYTAWRNTFTYEGRC